MAEPLSFNQRLRQIVRALQAAQDKADSAEDVAIIRYAVAKYVKGIK